MCARGTDDHNFVNWFEDIRTNRRQAPLDIPEANGALVHAGFLSMWRDSGLRDGLTDSMAHLLSAVGWDGPLYITGHSLGGALASLCAVYMKHTFVLDEVNVYTFGSPRVGNLRFKEVFQTMVGKLWTFLLANSEIPALLFLKQTFFCDEMVYIKCLSGLTCPECSLIEAN